MFQDLTLQQFCALDHQRNMVVTAGPGAGKTRILSYRYCFLLLMDDQLSIPGILTLTFTEKAAEEMKARIYTGLSRMVTMAEHGPASRSNKYRDFQQNNLFLVEMALVQLRSYLLDHNLLDLCFYML